LVYYFTVIVFILFVLMAVFEQDFMRSAIYFALSSVALAVIFYVKFNAMYAAAFELSICAGLIVVLFMASISLITEPEGKKEGEI
jgi:NADH-quinone oxidoreductase subunit J